MKVSLASTSEYSAQSAESIKDMSPNAADILITSVITSMVTDLGVISPTASGLITFHTNESSLTRTLDGYFVAPNEFQGNDHEEHRITMTYGGHVETCKGANTFAVPGIYKILDYIYKNYASLPLQTLLEYPVNIAKNGFKLTQPSKDYFIHSMKPMFMWHDYSKEVLSDVYDDIDQGTVKLTKLSDTMDHLSREGFNDFYTGDVSKSILSTIQEEGGHATKDDFESYELIEDSKFKYKFKDLTLIGNSGPSIGGLMVLKYIEGLNTKSKNIEEILKNIYSHRKENYEFFGKRKDFIDKEITKLSKSPSTIHVGTSDDDNNHFSITFSSGYGSGVLCKNTGMYFNNSLGEIELNPQGFLGDSKGDRLISNMSPLIVKSKNSISTIGSPGADRISSAIAQVILNFTNGDSWIDAINKSRFHVNEDGSVRAEPGCDLNLQNITITEPLDMYFGGVCVTGLDDNIFSYGDKRRGNTTWSN